MKWVTREHAKVDRIAYPWLIRRFIDADAEFLSVPADAVPEVAAREGATPFDVPGVELGHHGADVSRDLCGRQEAPGLKAIAVGFSRLGLRDDHELLAREAIVYDALYSYCQQVVDGDEQANPPPGTRAMP